MAIRRQDAILNNSTMRACCWTWNNPNQLPTEVICLFSSVTRYIVFQKEQGELGTVHYQGYMEFNSPIRLSKLKKINSSIHYESRRGTPKQARDYAMKAETRLDGPWENGIFNGEQGKRNDLEELYSSARNFDLSLRQIADEHPSSFMKYYKAVNHVRMLEAFDKPKQRTNTLQVIVYYGPPGTGKTRRCYDIYPGLYAIPLGKDLWFDGYRGEKEVLLDDFSGNLRLVDTLRLLDRYPIQVPIKGGYVWWNPDVVFITTNVHPINWYNYNLRTDSWAALIRRITAFHECKKDQTEFPDSDLDKLEN